MNEQAQGYDPAVEGFEEDYGETVGDMDLRVIYDGFAFDFKCRCSINDIPHIVLELKSQGMKPAKSALLWPEDMPEGHRPITVQPGQAPPQAAAPPPQQQPQGQPTGWDSRGNTTYDQMPPPVQNAPPPAPTRFNPDGTPYCPYHNEPMAVSKFGGWYCQKKKDDTPPHLYHILNAKGYCSYSYKGHNG